MTSRLPVPEPGSGAASSWVEEHLADLAGGARARRMAREPDAHVARIAVVGACGRGVARRRGPLLPSPARRLAGGQSPGLAVDRRNGHREVLCLHSLAGAEARPRTLRSLCARGSLPDRATAAHPIPDTPRTGARGAACGRQDPGGSGPDAGRAPRRRPCGSRPSPWATATRRSRRIRSGPPSSYSTRRGWHAGSFPPSVSSSWWRPSPSSRPAARSRCGVARPGTRWPGGAWRQRTRPSPDGGRSRSTSTSARSTRGPGCGAPTQARCVPSASGGGVSRARRERADPTDLAPGPVWHRLVQTDSRIDLNAAEGRPSGLSGRATGEEDAVPFVLLGALAAIRGTSQDECREPTPPGRSAESRHATPIRGYPARPTRQERTR